MTLLSASAAVINTIKVGHTVNPVTDSALKKILDKLPEAERESTVERISTAERNGWHGFFLAYFGQEQYHASELMGTDPRGDVRLVLD